MPSRTRKSLAAASCILAMGVLLAPAAARGGSYFLQAEAGTLAIDPSKLKALRYRQKTREGGVA